MGEEIYYFRKANTRLLDILGCNCGQHKHNGKRVPQLCTGMCQGECSLKNCRGARVTCPGFLYPAASFDISTIQHFFAHLFRRFPFLLPQGGAPTPTITPNTLAVGVAPTFFEAQVSSARKNTRPSMLLASSLPRSSHRNYI